MKTDFYGGSSTNGTVGVWMMNGEQPVDQAAMNTIAFNWVIIDRDFGALSNGDLGHYFLIARPSGSCCVTTTLR